MESSLAKRLVIIKTDGDDQGSGIIISNDGIIASCYHNFYFQKSGTDRLVTSIKVRADGHWDEITYNDNIANAFGGEDIKELKRADLFFLRCFTENKLGNIGLSNNIQQNEKVWIVAWDKSVNNQCRVQEGEVLSIEQFTEHHPSRLHLNITGYPGFSGGGVFNKNSELIGIINYIKENRSDEIIASIIPDWLINRINFNCAKKALNQNVMPESIALSIPDLRKPLRSILKTRRMSIFPRGSNIVVDPLELISAKALVDHWYDCDPARFNDEYPEIRTLLTPLDELARSNKEAERCLNLASKDDLLDDDQYKLCLAGYRLAKSLEAYPEHAEPIIRKVLEQTGINNELQKQRQTVLSLSFFYWPEGGRLLYQCGEDLIQTDPLRLTGAHCLDVLDQTVACDIMLGTAWYSDDIQRIPLSQRWAEATGWLGLLPDIFLKLFKGSVERLVYQWKSVPLIDRYPYIRAFRLSNLNISELGKLGLAIKCSLPDANQGDLQVLKQSPELMTWLRLMQEPEIKEVTENHLQLLVEIMARSYTLTDRRLAEQAREALTVPHRDLEAVWEALGSHCKLWVTILTDAELNQDNVKKLAQRKTACDSAASKLLISRLARRQYSRTN